MTAEGPINSQHLVRPYDRLQAALRTNDRGAVEETCRALLQIGRPFSEILSRSGLDPQTLQTLQAEVLRRPYYWGPQWNVRPHLSHATHHLGGSPTSDVPPGSGVTTPDATASAFPRSALEPPPESRSDLVEEWRARQQVTVKPTEFVPPISDTNDTDDSQQETGNVLGAAVAAPEIVRKIRERLSGNSGENLRGRHWPGARLWTIGGFSVAVAAAGWGLYFYVHPGTSNRSSVATDERFPAKNLGDSARTRDLSQPSSSGQVSAAAEPNVATRAETAAPVSEPALGSQSTSIAGLESNLKFPAMSETTSQVPAAGVPAPDAVLARSTESLRELESTTKQELKSPPVAINPTVQSSAEAAPAIQSDPNQITAPVAATAPSERPVMATPSPSLNPAPTLANPTPSDLRPKSPSIDNSVFLARGDVLLGSGDVASARLFYERAADAGNAQAAIRLGETFDPIFLADTRLNGVRGDPAVALKWYKRARELGASEADVLVTSIERR